MKKKRLQTIFLDQLRKIPIVSIAAEKSGVSRTAIYDWRKDDAEFRKKMEEALAEGEDRVNDMSESQLLAKIQNGEWPPTAFWLRKRHPKFRDRLEITGMLQTSEEILTPEKQALVEEALRRLTLPSPKPDPDQIPPQP